MRERTVDEIIIIANAGYRGIRIIAGQDGVAKFPGLRCNAFIRLTIVVKHIEPGRGGI